MAIRELKQDEINAVSGGAGLLGLDLGGLLTPVLNLVSGLLNTVTSLLTTLLSTVTGLLSGLFAG